MHLPVPCMTGSGSLVDRFLNFHKLGRNVPICEAAQCLLQTIFLNQLNKYPWMNDARWGGGQGNSTSLASLSTKRAIQVRARLDPLVTEKWNSITVLLTHSHQCRQLVKKRPSMCYYVCVIMHVKDP